MIIELFPCRNPMCTAKVPRPGDWCDSCFELHDEAAQTAVGWNQRELPDDFDEEELL